MERAVTRWTVWAVSLFGYVLAVTNRTSLSALGPAAQEHFEVGSTVLSSFAVLQLAVYAIMQVPVGVLIDRVGPARLILSGLLLMTLGQAAMATLTSLPLVYLARIVIGAGDAAIFTSFLRIIVNWFPPKNLPVITQASSLIGQLGQIISVYPFAALAGMSGWSSAFRSVAGLTLFAFALALFLVREGPSARTSFDRIRGAGAPTREITIATGSIPVVDAVHFESTEHGRSVWRQLVEALRVPGVRLAFWVHFTTPFSASVILMLWGYPFLTAGIGMSEATAKLIFLVMTVVAAIAGLVIGWVTSRLPRARVFLAVAIVVAILCAWLAVLLWPGVPPHWLVVVTLLLAAIGTPASMISFDIVRTHVPKHRAGTATGVVNVGGFVASLVTILIVGLLLSAQGVNSPAEYSFEAFRVALSSQLVLWALGLSCIFIEYGKAKRDLDRRGISL